MNDDGFQAFAALLYIGLPTLVVGSIVFFLYRGITSSSAYHAPVGPVRSALPPSPGRVGRRIDPGFSATSLSTRLQRLVVEAFTTATGPTAPTLAAWLKPDVITALRARHDVITSVDSVGITRVHPALFKHAVADNEERLVVRVEVAVARDVHRADHTTARIVSREEWTVSRPILTDDVARAGDSVEHGGDALGCPGCGDANGADDVDGLQLLVDQRRCSACGSSLVAGARDWGVDEVRVLGERVDDRRDIAGANDDVVVDADDTARADLVAVFGEQAGGELLSRVRELAAELHRAFHARDREGVAARTRPPLRRRLLHALRDERTRPARDVVVDATLLRFEVDGPWAVAVLRLDGVAPLPRFWTVTRRTTGGDDDTWSPIALHDGDDLVRG